MIKTKKVDIDGFIVTVSELTVSQLRGFFTMPAESSILNRIDFLLKQCAPDFQKLADPAPSEYKPIMDAMLEVNSSFFEQAEALDMGDAAKPLRKIISGYSIVAFRP